MCRSSIHVDEVEGVVASGAIPSNFVSTLWMYWPTSLQRIIQRAGLPSFQIISRDMEIEEIGEWKHDAFFDDHVSVSHKQGTINISMQRLTEASRHSSTFVKEEKVLTLQMKRNHNSNTCNSHLRNWYFQAQTNDCHYVDIPIKPCISFLNLQWAAPAAHNCEMDKVYRSTQATTLGASSSVQAGKVLKETYKFDWENKEIVKIY